MPVKKQKFGCLKRSEHFLLMLIEPESNTLRHELKHMYMDISLL